MSDDLAIGLEVCLEDPPDILCGKRFGVLCNQASVDRSFRYAHHLLAERFPGQLAAVFGPQHGLWSKEQDNMIETGHGAEPRLGVPVYSLYSETRSPTPSMLEGLDLLVVDLQDVGTRIYTYVWTLTLCLEACAERGIPVIVLDRPNPLGGELVEGPPLDPAYQSFVGRTTIPMRHGLTLGELTRFCNAEMALGAEVHVLPMRGWRRQQLAPDTGRQWIPPSPNLPRFPGALVYPGQVLWEGTRLSEGRGTTTPFELFGAPWIDPWELGDALAEHRVPGLAFRPLSFEPTFQKHCGRACGGLFLHVTDPSVYRPYRTTLTILRLVAELWPEEFAWLPPPYEYESGMMPIDILTGNSSVRNWVDDRGAWTELEALSSTPSDWWDRVRPHLRYR